MPLEEEMTLDELMSDNPPEPAPTDDSTPTPLTDDESVDPAPAEPEPEPEPEPANEEDPRIAQLIQQNEMLMEMLKQRSEPEKPQAEPEPDVAAIINEHFQGASAEALSKVFAALDRRFARRGDVEQYQTTAAQLALDSQERKAMEDLRNRGVPEADITTARDRIYEAFRKNPGKALWSDPAAAFKDVLSDILIERQYKKADDAAARQAAVRNRAAKQVQPSPATPAANKVQLDIRQFRKEFKERTGRTPDVSEVADWAEKAGQ